LRALVEALKRPGSIAELVAQVGMGKTSLLKKLAHDYAGTFDGAIEYFGGNPSFQLTEGATAIAERFRAASGRGPSRPRPDTGGDQTAGDGSVAVFHCPRKLSRARTRHAHPTPAT